MAGPQKPPGSTVKPVMRTAPNYLEEDRLSVFGEKPADFTDEQFSLAKEVAVKVGSRLPSQVEQSAFYFYYMGSSWEEIANKLNIPIGVLLYTAIYYNWPERKKLVTSVRAGEKVTRADAAAIDLITDTIVATSAIYKTQLAEVIKDPSAAKSCPLIPKNFKDLQVLLQMLQSLQSRDVDTTQSKGAAPIVNVNVANLQQGEKQKSYVETQVIEQLPEESDAERMQILELLEKVKNK